MFIESGDHTSAIGKRRIKTTLRKLLHFPRYDDNNTDDLHTYLVCISDCKLPKHLFACHPVWHSLNQIEASPLSTTIRREDIS